MTLEKQIALARSYLPGNPGAYGRMMAGSIRAARSEKTNRTLRAAIHADIMQGQFHGLDTDCPIAK